MRGQDVGSDEMKNRLWSFAGAWVLGALLMGTGPTGCAQIGSWLEEIGDEAEEAGEEIEDEIDDATDDD